MVKLNGKYFAYLRELCLAELVSLHPKEKPHLAIVQVGDIQASNIYISKKIEAASRCCIKTSLFKLDESISQQDFVETIKKLSSDVNVDAIIVQLPLPHQRFRDSLDSLAPSKDVDCLTTYNQGNLFKGTPTFSPCTPLACLKLIDLYFHFKEKAVYIPDPEPRDLSGLVCLVVGRSNLVGKPLAQMLLQRNGTVIQAHSKTQNLESLAKFADLIFLAVGKPRFFKASWCKPSAVVIDIGISFDGQKLVGDLDLDSDSLSGYTPVPGGVGPMTVQMLLENVYKAFKNGPKSASNKIS